MLRGYRAGKDIRARLAPCGGDSHDMVRFCYFGKLVRLNDVDRDQRLLRGKINSHVHDMGTPGSRGRDEYFRVHRMMNFL
jgi:hypothetical protein